MRLDEYGAYSPNSNGVDTRELKYASHIADRYELVKGSTLNEEKVYTWASESVSLAAMAYLNDPNFNVDQHYYIHSLPTIEQQLYKAGIRIAQLLNLIVGANGPCPLCSWKAPLCRPVGFPQVPAICEASSNNDAQKYSYFRDNNLW